MSAATFECDKCGATFEDGIDAGHHDCADEAMQREIDAALARGDKVAVWDFNTGERVR